MKTLRYIFCFIILLVPSIPAVSGEVLLNDSITFVRKIKLDGAHPYLNKKILRLSSLQSGDIYKPEALQESIERIESFFIKDGYINAKVKIQALADKKPNFVNLHITIDRGPYYRIGQIDITGNDFLSSKFIRNKIGTQSRFSYRRVKNRISKIEKKYSRNGYVRNRIKLSETALNTVSNKIDLTLLIKERKKVHINFSGNSWFESSTLKDQTSFNKEKSYDKSTIEQSAKHIQAFYLMNGFLDASVSTQVINKPEAIDISFTINEGVRTRLKEIRIVGLKQLDKSEVLAGFSGNTYSLTRQGIFRPETINADLALLKSNYQNNGFFDQKIISHDVVYNSFRDLATLIIEVSEGDPYKIGQINLENFDQFESRELKNKLTIKSGKPYQTEKLDKSSQKLLKFVQGKGYPLATLKREEIIDADERSVDIFYRLSPGPMVRINDIIIQGLYATQKNVVIEASKIKPGDLFTYDKLLKGQFNIKRMDIFDHVSISPLNLSLDSEITDILISLKERKRTTFDIQAGFDSDKLANGEIVLTQRNLFGSGKHIQFKGIGGFELSRGEINLISPRMFGASWNILNQYFVEYEDDENFNAFSYGGSIGAFKNFGRDWALLLKSQINRFNLIEAESNAEALDANLFDNTFAELIASIAFDSRDNYADPKHGLYSVASAEFDSDLSDITNDFVILKLSASHYLTFFDKVTLSNTFRLGDINILTDGTRIPATKLFFMGGNDTIRGFQEDAILDSGGQKSLMYNAELGFRFSSSIQLAGFADIGSLTNAYQDINSASIRQSAGLGLRYITPVGPIRIDYGFILDRALNEPRGRFHFTFGYFF